MSSRGPGFYDRLAGAVGGAAILIVVLGLVMSSITVEALYLSAVLSLAAVVSYGISLRLRFTEARHDTGEA